MDFQQRSHYQTQFETWYWAINDGAAAQYQIPELAGDILVPNNPLALTVEDEERQRIAGVMSLAWQMTPNLSVSLTAEISNVFQQDLTRFSRTGKQQAVRKIEDLGIRWHLGVQAKW